MNESQLMAWVLDIAKQGGWMAYHTYDSRKSQAGFPDLILVRGSTLLAIELKVGRNKVTAAQTAWLEAFAGVREVEALVIRDDGTNPDAVLRKLLRKPVHVDDSYARSLLDQEPTDAS